MKQNLLLFLSGFAFLIFCAFGHRREQPVCAIINTKTNYVFQGIDNPIDISVAGVDSTDLVVTADSASISGSNGHYVCHVKRPKTSWIIIHVSRKNGKEICRQKFRIKGLPDPVCTFKNILISGALSKQDFTSELGIFARMVNFDYDMTYKVKSFDMTTLVNGAYVTEKAEGPSFTPAMKKLMDDSKSGDRFFIENVKVMEPDSTERRIPGVTVTVK